MGVSGGGWRWVPGLSGKPSLQAHMRYNLGSMPVTAACGYPVTRVFQPSALSPCSPALPTRPLHPPPSKPQIDAFAPAFWPGPLFHDTSKSFYAALNGGTPLRGSLLPMANPFGAVWARIRAASRNVKEHNVVGDGLTMGGLLMMRAGEGGPAWLHLETEIGLVAEPEVVLGAAQRMMAA